MKIVSLTLRNIRKYGSASFKFRIQEGSQRVVITGPNGSGKTTVLESIILPFRGFVYGSGQQRFVKKGETAGEICLSLFTEALVDDPFRTKHEIRARITLNGESSVSLDKKETTRENLRKIGDVFWFFPQDILIVLGGEEERRSFLDTVLKFSDPGYMKILKEYQYSLKARNAVLRKVGRVEDVYRDKELDAVEEVLAKSGRAIVEKRMRLVEELNGTAQEILQLASGKLNLKLQYATSFKCGSDIEESLLESLYVSRGTDCLSDATSVGPHRDRVTVLFNGRQARYEASYGERKLAAFALKVAAYVYIKKKKSENITFLADDVFSELDIYYKELLLEILVSCCKSFFATATELNGMSTGNFDLELLNLVG